MLRRLASDGITFVTVPRADRCLRTAFAPQGTGEGTGRHKFGLATLQTLEPPQSIGVGR